MVMTIVKRAYKIDKATVAVPGTVENAPSNDRVPVKFQPPKFGNGETSAPSFNASSGIFGSSIEVKPTADPFNSAIVATIPVAPPAYSIAS